MTSATPLYSTIAPPLKRRLASMLYEAMLLFGVVAIAGLLFATLLGQRHALAMRHGLQYWLFLVLGFYFIWFWTHSGQTLAMKTWRIRLVCTAGTPVTPLRAAARYLLAWIWVLPGLAAAWAMEARGQMLLVAPAINIAVWASLAWLDPQRQFIHDRVAGTRLVTANLPPKK